MRYGHPGLVGRVFGIAAALGMAVSHMHCSDSSIADPCPRVDDAGRCISTPPTPVPCNTSLCPFALSWSYPFPNQPLVAVVTAVPAGPYQLQVNGTFPGFPDGLALVRVGDLISGSRCCGSTVVYIVN